MKLNNCLKLCWAIFLILGLCIMGSQALADENSLRISDNEGFFNRQLPLGFEENKRASLRPDYFHSLSGDFNFKDADDELIFASNKTYSSALKERPENTSLRGRLKLDSNYFKGIFSDARYALTSPKRWDKADWTTASIVAGATGVFFVLDDEINAEIKDNRSSTTDDISELFEHFGNGAITLPAVAGFYLYGRFGENEKIERTALLAAESFLVSGLFSTIIKVGVGRHRPNKDNNSSQYDGFSTSNKSFPSGHTTTAFAIATVVANEYEDVPLAAPLAYGVATLAGLSRINDNQHWASDVFFGAVLGYFTSKTILKLHSNKKGRHFTIYPRANYQGGGLVLSSKF